MNEHFDILYKIKFILFTRENKSKISYCTCKSLQNPNNGFGNYQYLDDPTPWLRQLLVMPHHKMLRHQLLTTGAWFQSQVSPRWTCGGQSGNGTKYFLSTSVSFRQVVYS